jgi:hypothetical protein
MHDLRHTYVTRLIEGGASDAVVRELVGHVDKQVIQRYTHIRRQAKKEAIQRAFAPKAKPHVKESPKVNPISGADEVSEETDKSLSIQ